MGAILVLPGGTTKIDLAVQTLRCGTIQMMMVVSTPQSTTRLLRVTRLKSGRACPLYSGTQPTAETLPSAATHALATGSDLKTVFTASVASARTEALTSVNNVQPVGSSHSKRKRVASNAPPAIRRTRRRNPRARTGKCVL